jgi:crotonobetaine/carnitine-CoA ligase
MIRIETPKDQWTLVHALRHQARRVDRAPVCEFLDARTLTYAELDAESDALATAFADAGLGPGDHVAILAANSPEFLLTVLAAHKRRAIVVPLNTELQGALLEHQVRDSRPKAIVLGGELAERVLGLPDDIADFAITVVIGPRRDDLPGPSASFADLVATPARPDAVLVPGPSDAAAILYTSGTTGPAKGVVLPHAHCFLFGALQARAHQLGDHDRVFIALPMFHVNALFMAFGSCLTTGADAVIARRFSASRWLADVRASGATVTNAVGVMAEFIVQQPASPADRDHRLRSVMAIPVAATWAETFERRFGVRLVQVYGMTECNIISFSDPGDPLEPGCTGPVLSELFDVAIVDADSDEPLPTGAVGEIVVRPRTAWGFMQGYFGRPETTLETWRNLWFHTGDAGSLDERGRLSYVDRLKDRIRRRGENISAFEVEQVIATHPAVAEAAVVGVRVARSGGDEEIKAYIVVEAEISARDIHAWLEPRLPRFAVPRFVELVEALDKTATGKIRKDELRARGITPATVDCAPAGAPR